MRAILWFFLASLLSQQCGATTWEQLTIEDVYKQAESVALVRIESGSMIKSSGHACGAKYKADVIEQFKGREKRALVFYDFGGMELGGKYLLFLAKEPSPFLGVATTNSYHLNWQEEFAQNCSRRRRGLQPLHAYGQIKVDFSLETGGDALEVPEMLFFFPSAIERYSGGMSRTQELYDTVWIKLDAAVAYLESISATAARQDEEHRNERSRLHSRSEE